MLVVRRLPSFHRLRKVSAEREWKDRLGALSMRPRAWTMGREERTFRRPLSRPRHITARALS